MSHQFGPQSHCPRGIHNHGSHVEISPNTPTLYACTSAHSGSSNSLPKVLDTRPSRTFILSAPVLYLALGEIYHPLCTPLSRSMNLDKVPCRKTHQVSKVCHPCYHLHTPLSRQYPRFTYRNFVTTSPRFLCNPMHTHSHTHTHTHARAHTYTRTARVRAITQMILLQVHLQKPCYDFSFL